MKTLENTKIGTKIICMIVTMALVAGAIAVYASAKLKRLNTEYSQMFERQNGAAFDIALTNRAIATMGYGTYMAVAQPTGGSAAEAGVAMQRKAQADAEKLLASALKHVPEKAEKIQTLQSKFERLRALSNAAMEHARKDEVDQAMRGALAADQAIGDFIPSGLALRKELMGDVQTRSGQLTKMNNEDAMVMIGGALTAAGLMLVVGLLISSRSITRPINALADRMKQLASGDLDVVVEGQARGDEVGLMAKAVQVFKDNGLKARDVANQADGLRAEAESERGRGEVERRKTEAEQAMVVSTLAASLGRLAQGDLTARIDAQFDGQYAQIKADFNSAIDSLREAMGAISNATTGISGGSDEIAAASDDLSRRTEQQAASLEETAAALDQITATVKRSAEGAKQASNSASGAKIDAEKSGAVMREAVSAMTEIEQSSGQITNIIGVIDEIAFQTNLLALNAGVEAARAGDAGKGFAVVAQEVRALAQRSAEAAKEIKTLIASSSTQVERGVKLVGDTRHALTGIVDKVAQIDALISEIAQSSQEQSTGLNQVNVAVNQMDQVTQQNAAMVEQATAAASNLKTEAGQLARLVARFQTGDAAPAITRPQLVEPGRHAPAKNPVAQARAKLTAFAARPGASAGQAADAQWEDF